MNELRASLPVRPMALSAGDSMPHHSTGPLTRTDFVRYAGAGGDFNPLHHDETAARAAGFPAVFGMGLFTAGLLGNRLARWVGPTNVRTYGVRFTGQVWPGDVLTFSGAVDAIDGAASPPIARLSLRVTSSSGDEVLRGWATAVAAACPVKPGSDGG